MAKSRTTRRRNRSSTPPDSGESDVVFTITEVSEYLKLSKSTAYKLAQEGKIPGQKVGRHWRFRKAAIDRWLEVAATDECNG